VKSDPLDVLRRPDVDAQAYVRSVSARITEEVRRNVSNEHARFGVPRKAVDSATKRVLAEMTGRPVSPEDAQALFRYMFERLRWL
jgi:hypothetical protein